MKRPLLPLGRSIRPRRRWLVLAAAVVIVVAYVRLGDVADPVWGYRVIDDRTIEVQTITGPYTWTRVATVGRVQRAGSMIVVSARFA
ncbi:MAG TPA: hypothetical protein VIK13_06235 [Candidatus Limnocylindrales bacterium]